MTGNNIGLQKKRSSKTDYFLILPRMIVCFTIGYLLGSSTTTLNSNVDNAKTVIAKVTTAESSIRNGNYSTNNSNGETYNTTANLPRQQNHSTSIIEEIIPTKLLPLYSHDKLQFNVTRSMLRQSRPVVGNTQRLHAYLKKLQSKQCTTVLFLGGSGKLSMHFYDVLYVYVLLYRCLLKTHTAILLILCTEMMQLLPVIMVEGFQTLILVGSWIGSMSVTPVRQIMEQLVHI